MQIPLLDLVAQFENIRDEVLPAITHVIERAQFILGDDLERFESEFAEFCDARYAVGVSSGTEALHLALRALQVGPGHEVITVANTFAATAFAISYVGASPVFVDVDPVDYNMDVELIERAITRRTKAIIPVHLYGQPANMDAILALARHHELAVVEDACQAHGAKLGDRKVGALGDIGCFSFYPGKNLGAYGDGGAVVTNRADLADRVRLLRNYGQRVKNVHSMLGFNSRLDTLQAAILSVKLAHLDAWNERRRRVARLYGQLLADAGVVLPVEKAGVHHVYHLYVIRHDARDALIDYMKQQKVFCGVHYPTPLCHAPPFQTARSVPDGAPVSTALSARILSLPMYPELTEAQVRHVAAGVASFCQQEAAA